MDSSKRSQDSKSQTDMRDKGLWRNINPITPTLQQRWKVNEIYFYIQLNPEPLLINCVSPSVLIYDGVSYPGLHGPQVGPQKDFGAPQTSKWNDSK